MPSSFRKFAYETGASAWGSASKTKVIVIYVLAWLIYAGIYVGILPEEVRAMTWVSLIAPTVLIVSVVIFLFYHAYLVWREAETKLEKRLEIVREVPPKSHDGYHRITIRNLSDIGVKFDAVLEVIEPHDISHHVPADLRMTGASQKGPHFIMGNGKREIDVFVDQGALQLILVGGGNSGFFCSLRSGQTYKLLVAVGIVDGTSTKQWFSIISNTVGKVSFEACENPSIPVEQKAI